MKHLLMMTAASFAVTATSTFAGGIERSNQSVGILFEEGTYGEFTYSTVSPSVSGTVGVPSGDMSPSYQNFSFGYKQDFGENLSFALILDQPIGADVSYPGGGLYPLRGSTATIDSHALTGLLRYKFPSNFSIYGGIRAQQLDAQVSLPTIGAYALTVPSDTEFGYVVGAAYEKPEIALRVALSYNSAITHTLEDNAAAPFDVTIPKSFNLEFQSGVAEDTLVFGSIRWVEWKAFDVSPPDYPANPLASGTKNTTSYSLGVGRRFNERWSGAVILGYEAGGDVTVGNLAPTNGYRSIGLAATYTKNNVKITGGIRYIKIGDVTTNPPISASFSGNSAIGVGVKVGFSF